MLAGLVVQGTPYSHKDVSCSIDSLPLGNLQSVSWTITRESGSLMKKGVVVGRTGGNLQCEGEISIPLADFPEIVRNLSAQGAGVKGWTQVEFSIDVTYWNPGTEPMTVSFTAASFGGASGDTAEGTTDPAVVTLPIVCSTIKINGIPAML